MSFNLCRGTPISPAPPTFQPRPIEPETNLWCDGLGVFRIFLDSFDDRGPRIRFRDNVLADGVLTGGPHFLNLERTRPPNARNGPASERNIALRGSILLKTYPAPSPDPMQSTTTDSLRDALRTHFGFDDFQPGQRAIIESVMADRPTVAIMPTGAGKSLCYQLPAVTKNGLTLVVSPLIALMKDQVDGLQERGIRADAINSSRTHDEHRAIMAAARRGDLDLLYVAPERFANPHFCADLDEVDVSVFAIDEAHCISRWGHDFRPDYRRLRGAAERVEPDVVLACTATATPEVREDIVASLGLDDPAVLVSGFLRDNLFLDVRFCGGERDKERLLLDFLQHGPGAADADDPGAIIIYASTRKRVDALASLLGSALDEQVVGYHAGMDGDAREEAQNRFMSGDVRVVVATNAFGMGVDRADVRAVVHAGMPRTIEAYYQEVGRAGRDGRRAHCLLLYNANDSRVHEFLIDRGEDEEHRALEHRKLHAMRRYVHTERCRHRGLLIYFGDHPPNQCPGCSRCHGQPRFVPQTDEPATDEEIEIVRKALAGVARANGRFGLRKVAGMLAGSRAKEITASSLASLSTYGILGSVGVEGCARLLQLLVAEGLCTIAGSDYPLLAIEQRGIDVMAGRESIMFRVPGHLQGAKAAGRVRQRTAPEKAPVGVPDDADPRIVEALRGFRTDQAGGKPAYTVFSNRTLYALACAPPASQEEFLATPGLGVAKWRRFGEALIEAVEAAAHGE